MLGPQSPDWAITAKRSVRLPDALPQPGQLGIFALAAPVNRDKIPMIEVSAAPWDGDPI
jgi:hypothetical protein